MPTPRPTVIMTLFTLGLSGFTSGLSAQAEAPNEHPAITPAPPKYTDDRTATLAVLDTPEDNTPRGTTLEWQLDVGGTYDNPFDARQIQLDAHVEQPDGSTSVVPGFFTEGFSRELVEGSERLTPANDTGWFVRFRPMQPGEHRVTFTLKNQDETIETPGDTFRVADAETPGFIRVSPHNPRAFAYDNGDSYTPVGINMAWPLEPGTYDYDRWFAAVKPHGMNWVRVWLAPHFNRLALERPTLGAGQLDMTSAWKIDYLVDLAEAHGIHLMLCFDAHGGLSTRVNPAWHDNAYNAKNGGPCAEPTDYWTNPEALALQRSRYRYAVARFGHSPAVFAWEFWNEMQYTDDSEAHADAIGDWHRQMAAYLKSVDPYGHLVTTSGGPGHDETVIEAIDDLDLLQTHTYNVNSAAAAVRRISAERSGINKPHLFGEMGISPHNGDSAVDKEGVHIHNMLWAGMFTPTPSTAMTWWWDNYLHPMDLWWQYGPVSRFMQGVPVADGPVRLIGYDHLRRAEPVEQIEPRLLRLSGSHSHWKPHPSNRPHRVAVARNGNVRGADHLSGLQHGILNHPEFANPVTFSANFVADGTFSVDVFEVSGHGGATLRITVDGDIALEKNFPDPNGPDAGGSTHEYDGLYTVNVPAGRHTIVVDNPGADWMRARYELLGPVTNETPWLDVHAITLDAADVGEPAVLAWFRNRDSVWTRAVAGESTTPTPAASLELTDLPDGDYTLQWWDTYTGESTDGGTVTVTQGAASIRLPEIERDTALRLIRNTPVAP